MQVRIASVNILYDHPGTPNSWPERRQFLVDYIKSLNLDVVGTQEGRKDQLLDLARSLGSEYEIVDTHREWHEVKMYPCLFVRKDRFKIVESCDRWLSETPEAPHSSSFGSRWPKLCVLAKVCAPEGGPVLGVGSFHFDNVCAEARPRQAEVLVQENSRFFGETPHVVVGDVNDGPDSQAVQVIRSSGYDEPWEFAAKPLTFHGFGQGEYRGRIDFLFHRLLGGPTVFGCDHRTDQYYSDHYLVWAEFTV